MYQGKYEKKHDRPSDRRRCRRRTRRLNALLLSMVLLVTVAIGGTLAYLVTQDEPITNTFTPSLVTCKVTETFDEDSGEKKEVNVQNTGDTDAYIRVRLVTYRTNAAGQHIGGTATIPEFTPGTNWVKYGDYYYYTLPVKPSEKPTTDLISSITLNPNYADSDGGNQAIDVMAEAIQSGPAEAVGTAWGVSISQGSVTAYQTE